MKYLLLLNAVVPLAFAGLASADDASSNWPQWRGPDANGVAPESDPPTEWSESKNVKWKIEIPGSGTSTPIVWGDKIFVTTAIKAEGPAAAEEEEAAPAEQEQEEGRRGRGRGRGGRGNQSPTDPYEFTLICLNRATGETIWSKTAQQEVPHEGHHQDHGFASHSPVTDGTHIYAYFGSRGIHCYDFDGELKWSKNLGKMQTRNSFGEGSSPLLVKDSLVINWDHEGDDFIVVLDKANGEERWRKERDEPTSWATPIAVEHDGKTQIIVNATNRIRSYDLSNGDVIWECGGMTTNVIPSPVAGDGMVYAASGFRGNAVVAIKLGHEGDLTDTDAIAWKHDTRTPYVPSPLLHQDRLYFFSQNTGILTVLNAKTGEVLIDSERLPDMAGVYASPVAVGDKVYLIGRNGEGIVIKASDDLEIISQNKLDENFDASPVILDDEIFLRGHKYLYCLSES